MANQKLLSTIILWIPNGPAAGRRKPSPASRGRRGHIAACVLAQDSAVLYRRRLLYMHSSPLTSIKIAIDLDLCSLHFFKKAPHLNCVKLHAIFCVVLCNVFTTFDFAVLCQTLHAIFRCGAPAYSHPVAFKIVLLSLSSQSCSTSWLFSVYTMHVMLICILTLQSSHQTLYSNLTLFWHCCKKFFNRLSSLRYFHMSQAVILTNLQQLPQLLADVFWKL